MNFKPDRTENGTAASKSRRAEFAHATANRVGENAAPDTDERRGMEPLHRFPARSRSANRAIS